MASMRTKNKPRAVVAAVLALLLCGLVSAPAADAGATRTMTYSTEWLGSAKPDYVGFRRIVGATLGDPRGWSLNGRVAFGEVAHGGELTIALASPAAIAGFPSCSAYYSCRVGGRVLINAERWRDATASYRGRALLHAYRQMVINHEVGHALGFGHADCARPGTAAAVMQQQSKGLAGCERNPWPLPAEREAYASRLGIRAPSAPRPFVLGRRVGHIELGARRVEVIATLGAPRRRIVGEHGTRIDSYARPQISVTYAGGRVKAISTRSRAGVGRGALAVGRRPGAQLLRDCPEAAAATRCRLTVHRRDGARTTVVLRHGRIALMRVERAVRSTRSAGRGGLGPAAPLAPPDPLMDASWSRSGTRLCAWWPALATRCDQRNRREPEVSRNGLTGR